MDCLRRGHAGDTQFSGSRSCLVCFGSLTASQAGRQTHRFRVLVATLRRAFWFRPLSDFQSFQNTAASTKTQPNLKTRFCTTGLSRRRQAARPSHPRVPGGHDFYPHRLVPCPRLPAAALNCLKEQPRESWVIGTLGLRISACGLFADD